MALDLELAYYGLTLEQMCTILTEARHQAYDYEHAPQTLESNQVIREVSGSCCNVSYRLEHSFVGCYSFSGSDRLFINDRLAWVATIHASAFKKFWELEVLAQILNVRNRAISSGQPVIAYAGPERFSCEDVAGVWNYSYVDDTKQCTLKSFSGSEHIHLGTSPAWASDARGHLIVGADFNDWYNQSY